MPDPLRDRSREIRSLLAQVLPGHAVRSIVRLGEGTDHIAYDVDGELIVRFAKDPDRDRRARRARAEAGVLAVARTLSPPAVPDPLLAVEDDGVLVYRRLAGTPLLDLSADLSRLDLVRFGEVIGTFLTRLHRTPLSALEDFVPVERPTMTEWLVDARQDYEKVADLVPAALHGAIETFLATSPPADPEVAVCCHNDLGSEHILVDPAVLVVTGIIDWGDVAITDPAYDLALVDRDLGTDALTSVLGHYAGAGEHVEDLRRRAEFYARCSVFEDVAYGLHPGREGYVVRGLASLQRLLGG